MSLPLTLACAEYDRTQALALGDVRPQGIDLTYLRMPVEEIFWRMTQFREFDAAEMSMSTYILRRSRGEQSYLAIPVFPSRFFRHSCIWVNAEAGIREPADLRGKRMGVPEYQMTAAVWARGHLEDDYGVRPSDMVWYQGGAERPGRVEKTQLEIPGVRIEPIPPDRTLSEMLATGELDAFMAARAPLSFDGVRVKRLFPSFRQVEQEYFRRTGIFPIMHTVVVRQEVYDRTPWVARNLFEAFCAAKQRLMDRIGNSMALALSLPWLLDEVESTRALMGEDYWPYGLEPNRAAIQTLLRYSHSQGLAERLMTPEELFAPSTLAGYVI